MLEMWREPTCKELGERDRECAIAGSLALCDGFSERRGVGGQRPPRGAAGGARVKAVGARCAAATAQCARHGASTEATCVGRPRQHVARDTQVTGVSSD